MAQKIFGRLATPLLVSIATLAAATSVMAQEESSGKSGAPRTPRGIHYKDDAAARAISPEADRRAAAREAYEAAQAGTTAQNGALINAASAKTLTYFGGPVLKNTQVVPVFWNSSVNYQTTLNNFYRDILVSPMYTSLLTQYSAIGAGTKSASLTLTKTGTSVTDAQIQSALTAAFNAGTLPKPNANTYYPVHFNPGVTITDSGGSKSCVVFCAYHGTYVYGGVNVNYGVVPDMGGACASGCGSSTTVNNLTSVASHELVEATTDPAVGLATTYAPPLAWYNKTYGEIGDICNAQQGTFTVGANTYTVQKEWSNFSSACKTVK